MEEVNSLIHFFFITKTLTKRSNGLGNCCKENMSKIQKEKAPVAEVEPEVEIITRVEYIYEDTKATTGSNRIINGVRYTG